MRKVKRWRYYCEFCKKSGASAGHMAKHERGCTRNPSRVCGICKRAKLEQKPTTELLEALERGGVKEVSDLADSCPACIMAAIMALRAKEPLEPWSEGDDGNYIEFDYKTAAKEFWETVNDGPQW